MIYAISDIHGNYEAFKKILKKINFNQNDALYIIGDVIDRGDESIPLLTHIMKSNNMKLLLGNHEYMLLQAHLLSCALDDYKLWFQNGGAKTERDYRDASPSLQIEINNYLLNSPIVLPNIKVGDKTFYLAHATYSKETFDYEEKKIMDLSFLDVERILWSRISNYNNIASTKVYEIHKKATLVVGHTPTLDGIRPGSIQKKHHGHYINIDCGCSYPNIKGRLGCICLNNLKETYVSL